jgi:hypothetical protein
MTSIHFRMKDLLRHLQAFGSVQQYLQAFRSALVCLTANGLPAVHLGGVPSDCVRSDKVEGVVYAVPSQVVVIASIEGDPDCDDASDDDDPRKVGVLPLRLNASTPWSDGGIISLCFFLLETSKLGGTFRILLLVLLWSLRLG